MKRFMLLLVASLMMSGVTMGQDQNRNRRQFNPEDMVKRQTEQMVEALDLDADQAMAVLKLNTERMKEQAGMRGQFGRRGHGEGEALERPTEEQMKAMREKMEASQKAYNEEMKKILTEEQYAKYEKMQQQFRGRGGMRGNRGGEFRQGGQRGQGFRGNRERNEE